MKQKRGPTRGYGLLEGFLAKQRYKTANRLLPDHLSSGRVLDIGCSEHPMFLMNTSFSQRYGVDKLITESHQKKYSAQKIVLEKYDVEENHIFPFEDGYFSAAFLLAVFEHIDPELLPKMMAEIKRILEPGGVFIMTTPAGWTNPILQTMSKMNLVSSHEIDEHKGSYFPGYITDILVQGGFEKNKIKCGYFELFMNIWAVAEK